MLKYHLNPIREPIIKAYLHIGMPFSILPVIYEENGWVYNTYIQLKYNNENPNDKFMDFTQQRFWEDYGIFTKIFIDFPALKRSERLGMLEELKFLLSRDYYIWGEWNEYYIPGSPAYGRFFFRHYFLAYGFKDDEIFVEGYLDDNHWHRFSVSEEIFINSLIPDVERDKNGLIGVNGYRPQKIEKFQFEIETVTSKIQDYLDSKGEKQNTLYGRKAITSFIKDLKESISLSGNYPIQSVYVIYEHKLMMLQRLKFMKKLNYCSENAVERYKKVERAFYSIICCCIKYNTTGAVKLGEQILEKVNEAMCLEEEILNEIF